MPKIALPLAACLLAAAALGAHAQSVWKWRDAHGQLHIGDSAPPPGTPQRNIISSPSGTGSGATAPVPSGATTNPAPGAAASAPMPASAPSSELEKRKLAADKAKADKQSADRAALDVKNAAIRKDNCQRATTDAANIQIGGRIARVNAQGEREILTDDQRAVELKHAQDVAAQNCGPAPAGQ